MNPTVFVMTSISTEGIETSGAQFSRPAIAYGVACDRTPRMPDQWCRALAAAADRAVTNVVPILRAAPAHRVREGVGLALRRPHIHTQTRGAQHAPAAGHDLVPGKRRARVEDLARQSCSALQAFDRVALARLLRVACRRHDDAEGGA